VQSTYSSGPSSVQSRHVQCSPHTSSGPSSVQSRHVQCSPHTSSCPPSVQSRHVQCSPHTSSGPPSVQSRHVQCSPHIVAVHQLLINGRFTSNFQFAIVTSPFHPCYGHCTRNETHSSRLHNSLIPSVCYRITTNHRRYTTPSGHGLTASVYRHSIRTHTETYVITQSTETQQCIS
jgi:hypothetical protein